MPAAALPASAFYRPLIAAAEDQGDPYVLSLPPDAQTPFRYYVYTTGGDPETGYAFPAYGSNDVLEWRPLGRVLVADKPTSHWAPCVTYLPALAKPYVMLYSRAIGVGEQGHVGHVIRRADAARPEGPFVDSGHALTADLDFAIDPDVYRLPDGSLRLAFAMDFVEDEPYGTGIVEADVADDLTALTSAPRQLARPQLPWHVYEPARVMPWKQIAGVDWGTHTVRWNTVEAPVGGLVSPSGKRVYLYSGGCFYNFYAVGALVEDDAGQLRNVTTDDANFVIRPRPEHGFFAPGHCSLVQTDDGLDYLMLHARFGAPDAPRQMCLAPLRWTDAGFPSAEGPA